MKHSTFATMDGDDDFFDACMDTADDYEEDDIGAEIGRYNVLDPDDVAKTLNEYIEDTITVFSVKIFVFLAAAKTN